MSITLYYGKWRIVLKYVAPSSVNWELNKHLEIIVETNNRYVSATETISVIARAANSFPNSQLNLQKRFCARCEKDHEVSHPEEEQITVLLEYSSAMGALLNWYSSCLLNR